MPKKDGLDVSWVLTKEQRGAGLNVRIPDNQNIDLYIGKKRVANFNPEYITDVKVLQNAAEQYKNNAPLLEQKGDEK